MKKTLLLFALATMMVASSCAKKPAVVQNATVQSSEKAAQNQSKAAYNVKTIPTTLAGKDVVSAIAANYKGKVVLIDFWATWCGPCRMAMKQIDDIKSDLMKKGCVFVYVTGETSPYADWQGMIKNIAGEHYRLTDKQWGFYWTGWHVNCMCYAIPVIMSEQDYWSGKQSIVTIPNNFTDWVKDNKNKVRKSSYLTQYVNFLESKPKKAMIAVKNSPETRAKLREFINKTIQEKFKEVELSDGQTARRLYLKNAGEEFVVGRNFFSETMAKNIRNIRLSETLQIAANVNDWFPNAKFERIENGKHHKFQFKVFSATFQGKQIECKAKLTSENILYTMRLLS